MEVSAFAFRDLIRIILPTIVAGCLFAPFGVFLNISISMEVLVFGGIVGGYLIYSPVAVAASLVQESITWKFFGLRSGKARFKWLSKNWDFDIMWDSLAKDEREYLYLTNAYFEFYQTVAFYFFLYAIVTAVLWWYHIVFSTQNVAGIFTVPILGGYWAPCWIMSPLALFMFGVLSRDAKIEYEALYGVEGRYVGYCAKLHKKDGGLAKGIWGLVLDKKSNPLKGIKVMIKDGGSEIGKPETDADGYYQLQANLTSHFNKQIKATIENKTWEGESLLQLGQKTVPDIVISATRIVSDSNDHTDSPSGLGLGPVARK